MEYVVRNTNEVCEVRIVDHFDADNDTEALRIAGQFLNGRNYALICNNPKDPHLVAFL